MKYTLDEKLKAVKYYLENNGYEFPITLYKKDQKSSYRKHVKFWVSLYLKGGVEALKHGKYKIRTAIEKYIIIKPVLDGTTSLQTRSYEVGIFIGTLSSWLKKYSQNGLDGLKCLNKKGRPPTIMKKEKQEQVTSENDEVSKLKKELEYFKLENEYLKKLTALVDARIKQEGKKKSKSLKKSSKAKQEES